jgi:hypothetical protein
VRFDPKFAAIDLAAQMIAYQGYTYDEIADITVVREYQSEVEARVDELLKKKHQAPTKRHFRYRTTEKRIRKLLNLPT